MLPPRAWSSRDSLSNKGMLRSDVEDCVVYSLEMFLS